MRLWALALAGIGAAAGLWRGPDPVQVLILSGDTDGNIAPCGCTKPMTGGIKRRVRAAKALSLAGHTTLVDNGNLVAGIGRQDQLKAQTIAQILGDAGWDAINVGPADARMGLGMVLSLSSLSGGKLVSSGLQESEIQRFKVSGPFLIIGISAQPETVAAPLGQPAVSTNAAISEGIAQAQEASLAPILLLQGSQADAQQLATQFPGLALIEYRSKGDATAQPERVGNTLLVSPGSDGKHILRVVYSGGQFKDYASIALGPEYEDDTAAARHYREYLSRVSSEKLLESLPRLKTVSFSGSQSCGTCHNKALSAWKRSGHAKALSTLEHEGHQRDPECLPCHVVGLQSARGFWSRQKTPDLAAVGCESCHGAGLAHSKNPVKVRLPKVTASTCGTCHTSNTSPDFDFGRFWPKIRH